MHFVTSARACQRMAFRALGAPERDILLPIRKPSRAAFFKHRRWSPNWFLLLYQFLQLFWPTGALTIQFLPQIIHQTWDKHGLWRFHLRIDSFWKSSHSPQYAVTDAPQCGVRAKEGFDVVFRTKDRLFEEYLVRRGIRTVCTYTNLVIHTYWLSVRSYIRTELF